jgi:hypothetical protein
MSAVDSATCWGRLLAAVAPSVLAKCGIRLGANDGARAFGAIDHAAAAAPASYGVIAKVRH